MTLYFEVTITEDVRRVKVTKKLLRDLADDISSAVSEHEKIEGNAVSCILSKSSVPIALLEVHWLANIECLHIIRSDVSTCACGWKSPTLPTVGAAVKAWITHVQQLGEE